MALIRLYMTMSLDGYITGPQQAMNHSLHQEDRWHPTG